MPRARPSLPLALAWLALAAGCRGADARPNLLLISVDTLRPDRLACYGGEAGTALCALADAGTRFTWAFSAAPSTAPSIASLLTSQYPRDHGVTELAASRLAETAPTLAEALADAGYTTAALVANPVLSRGRGFERGFAVYDDRMTRRERNRPQLVEREAAELTDAALAWLRVAREPWFLWVHYQDPHGPYEPPDATPAHDPEGAPRLPLLADQSGWKGIPAYQALPGLASPPAYERRYGDEIRWLDRHVGRLLAAALALPRATAILATADHGEAFGEDGFWFAHGHSLGIDQIRVPLLWRPPTQAGARVEAEPVSTLDVAPTLLEAAGVRAPEAFTGQAFGTAGRDRPLFAEHRLRIAALLGPHYYARDREPFGEPQPDRVSGGRIPPLPPRAAQLPASGAWPGYSIVAPEAAALEPTVRAFLESPERPGAEGPARSLDPSAREALRALGYLE